MVDKYYDDLISVIVPVYNVEKYLDRCMESICRQTYSNLEIILVDDGSTDLCPVLCDNWAKLDSRVRVIHKKNGGLSSARNAGIIAAHGKYLGFVDSDDYIHTEMYEKLHDAICKNNADLAICSFKKMFENGSVDERLVSSPLIDGTFNINEILHKLNMTTDEYVYFVVAWNRLYRKELFNYVNFPIGKIHEDEFTAHMFYDHCTSITTIKDSLYYYMIRENSIMNKPLSNSSFDGVEGVYSRYQYLILHELTDVAISNILFIKRILRDFLIKDRGHLYREKEKYWIKKITIELVYHKKYSSAMTLLGIYIFSFLPDSIYNLLKKVRNKVLGKN